MNGTAFDISWSPPTTGGPETVKSLKKTLAPTQSRLLVSLQDFQSQGVLDFGSVQPFSPDSDSPSYRGTVELDNSLCNQDITVQLDRFSTRNYFSIEHGQSQWNVPAGGSTSFTVLWRPETPGGVRQTLTFSFVNPIINRRVRVGAFLCGVTQEPENTPPLPTRRKRPSPMPKATATKRQSSKVDEENSALVRNTHRVEAIKQKKPAKPLQERSPNQGIGIGPTKGTAKVATIRTEKPQESPPGPRAPKALPSRTLTLRHGNKTREEAVQKATRKELKMRRVLFDEKWMEKQEKGFAAWLNFLMAPDIEDLHAGDGMEALQGAEGSKRITDNPFAVLARKQRTAAIQRVAYTIYHSSEMENVAFQVDREIASGGIAIRVDRDLFKDLGLRRLVLDLLFNYNGPWLRLGLEIVLGMSVPGNPKLMRRVATKHFLGDPELDETFRDSKKGLFDENPEYKSELRRRTLRRFLMLVMFLDRAKLASVIDNPSCLFSVDSKVKSSNEMIINFAKEFLSGEGNVIKHLQHSCAYTLYHKQTVLDEFDFKVSNLAVDLRDGLRLTRAVELLTENKNRTLSQLLRVPAVSRLQKLHNVGVALKELEQCGIDMGTIKAPGQRTFNSTAVDSITSKDLVDGNRRKTLGLLWKMITKWRLSAIMPIDTIQDETRRVLAIHGPTAQSIQGRSVAQAEQQRLETQSKSNPEQDSEQVQDVSAALLAWCQAVCAHHGMRVSNFTASMASGKALCLLIHHYHPKLLERETINPTVVDIAHKEKPDLVDADLDWMPFELPSLSRSAFRKALAGEQANFRLVNECASALGCVPVLLPEFDSENIPEEKLMLLFLAYLCSRLLSSRDEIAAAIKIQRVWLAKRHAQYLRNIGMRGEAAARVIQTSFRRMIAVKKFRQQTASCRIQAAFRGHVARTRIARMHAAVTKVQALFRASLAMADYTYCRDMIIIVQSVVRQHQASHEAKNLRVRINSSVTIQSAFRGHCTRKALAGLSSTAVVIQSFFRCHKARVNFCKRRSACLLIQAQTRGALVRRVECFSRIKASAIVIQKTFRALRLREKFRDISAKIVKVQAIFRCIAVRANFLYIRDSCVLLQSTYRRYKAVEALRESMAAAISLQSLARMLLAKNLFESSRSACIKLQSLFRMCAVKRAVKMQRSASVKIQSLVRMHQSSQNFLSLRLAVIRVQAIARKRHSLAIFQRIRNSVVAFQAVIRRAQVQKSFLATRSATVKTQALVRGLLARRDFKHTRSHCVEIQSAWRMVRAKRELAKGLSSLRKIQAWTRSVLVRERFSKTVHHVVSIQSFFRQALAMKKTRADRERVVLVQSVCRSHVTRSWFLRKKRSVCVLQSFARMVQARDAYLRTRENVIRCQSLVRTRQARVSFQRHVYLVQCIQSWTRRSQAMSKLRVAKKSVIKLQALGRGRITRQSFVRTRSSIVRFQAIVRAHQLTQAFREQVQRVVAVQSLVRMRCASLRFVKFRASVIKLQSLHRMRQCQRTVQKDFHSVVTCQAAVRKWLAHRRTSCMLGNCLKLQSAARTLITRRRYLDQYLRVVQVQAATRAWIARRRLGEARSSAAKLQSFARMVSCRVHYQREYAHVCKLQAVSRAWVARSRFIHLKASAVLIQSQVRSHQCTQNLLKTRRGVTLFQAVVRAKLGLRAFQESRARVVYLQAIFRGYLIRKDVVEKNIAASRIQGLARGHATRKQVALEVNRIVIVQALFRGRIARFQQQKAKVAATLIQAHARRLQSVNKFNQTRAALVVVQSLARMNSSRKKFLAKRLAATKLQAVSRGMLDRIRLFQVSRTSCTLQSFARMVLCRTRYLGTLESIKTVQALARGHLARVERERRSHAAVKIQAVWRSVWCRVQLHRVTESIVKVQAFGRMISARVLFSSVKNAVICLQQFGRKHCLAALRHRGAICRFQAILRGYMVRRRRSKELVIIAKRLRAANANYNESMTLGSRTRSALDWLLRSKDLAHILKACITLQVCTAASKECAESFLETDASDVLFALIRSCNRSEPHVRVLEVALTVLVQVAWQDQKNCYGRVFAAEAQSVASLIDILQMFRDKVKLSSLALTLLSFYCMDARRSTVNILCDRDLFKRVRAIEQVMQRKCEVLRQNRSFKSKTSSAPQNGSSKSSAHVVPQLSERQQYSKLRAIIARLESA